MERPGVIHEGGVGQGDREDTSCLKGAAASQHQLIVIMTDCEMTVARFSDFLREARDKGFFCLFVFQNHKCDNF